MERVGRHNDRTDRMIRPNGDRADSRSPLLFINSQRSRSLCFKYLVRYTAAGRSAASRRGVTECGLRVGAGPRRRRRTATRRSPSRLARPTAPRGPRRLADPRPVLHAAGDPAHSRLAVNAAQPHVVSAEVFRHHGEHFVVVGHSEVPTPGFFAHTVSMTVTRISDGRYVCACLVCWTLARVGGGSGSHDPTAVVSAQLPHSLAAGSRPTERAVRRFRPPSAPRSDRALRRAKRSNPVATTGFA